jgi:TRAP-type uncharacterized transport system substrate-binding protein
LVLGVHTEEPAPTIAQLLAEIKPDGQEITVRAFDDVASLGEELAAGTIDLALLEGIGGNASGIMLVADLYPSVLHILYRGDQTPGPVDELLDGHTIWAGAPGGIGHRLVQSLGADFGLPPDRIHLLDDPWSQEPDVYFIFGGILDADALSRLQGFRLFSLGDAATLMHGSVAEGVSLRYPQLQPFVLPAQLYPALNDAAALTLSVSTLLVAREGLGESVVYDLAMEIAQIAPQIAARYPLAGLPRMNQEDNASRELALHPGARRYRDRDLPGFVERNVDVLGLWATVIITIGSVLLALRSHRQQSRKDRLDSHYQKLLLLRAGLNGGGGDKQLAAAEIRASQAEVMTLVIEERIDADGALVAFLSLSNQLLAEAERA